MNYKPKAGDIVRSDSGQYRMYYTDDWSKNLRCMNLEAADSYDDSYKNSEGTRETYICNMKDIVNATR
jgi:hypothetical protein